MGILQTILEQANMKGLTSEWSCEAKSEEELLERRKKYTQSLCDVENTWVGNLDKFDGHNCEICKNRGYVMRPRFVEADKDYEPVQVECSCNKVRQSIISLKESGLQSVVDDYRIDNYETTEKWQEYVLSTAKDYIANGGDNWFFIGGQSGCGKTHICTAISVEIIKRGNKFKYMLWKDESRKIKSGLDIIDEYKNADFLYIDDLFKAGLGENQMFQRPTQSDINIAFEIINSRIMQKKPTIISSESTMTELLDIDSAIGGRIRRACDGGKYSISIERDCHKNYRLK